jgi:hypothetical protein
MSNGPGYFDYHETNMVAGLALSASSAITAGPNSTYAQAQPPEKSLYERLAAFSHSGGGGSL